MKLVKNVRKMSTIPLQYSNFFDKIYYTVLCYDLLQIVQNYVLCETKECL